MKLENRYNWKEWILLCPYLYCFIKGLHVCSISLWGKGSKGKWDTDVNHCFCLISSVQFFELHARVCNYCRKHHDLLIRFRFCFRFRFGMFPFPFPDSRFSIRPVVSVFVLSYCKFDIKPFLFSSRAWGKERRLAIRLDSGAWIFINKMKQVYWRCLRKKVVCTPSSVFAELSREDWGRARFARGRRRLVGEEEGINHGFSLI